MKKTHLKQNRSMEAKQSKQMLAGYDNREDTMTDEIIPPTQQGQGLAETLNQLEINTFQCDSGTVQELTYLLTNVLKYPSTVLAQKHSKANRLGAKDVIEEDGRVHKQTGMPAPEHCPDCGLIVQQESIPFCSSFHTFPNIGIATYLLFTTIKNLSILLLVLGAVYSGYALYINITQPSSTLSLSNMAQKLSYASLILNYQTNSDLQTALMVQSWLLVAVILIWMVCLFIINSSEISHKRLVDNNTITAADFSIMIENIPYQITSEQLQSTFDIYHQQLVEKNFITKGKGPNGNIERFRIKKICRALPYHLLENERIQKEINDINQQMEDLRNTFSDWVNQVRKSGRFPTNKSERQRSYSRFNELKKGLETRKRQLQYQASSRNSQIGETTIFISFERSQSANILGQLNPHSISSKMKYYLSCCSSALYYEIPDLSVKLSRAPEPEDINWNNIGVEFSSIVCRKFLTYFVTAVLLGASFGIVYGLTLWQISTNNSIITYAVSMSISLLNVLIGVAVQVMTAYERDFTKTNREISYALKSIMAQLMNSVLVPVITNILVKQNLYYQNGLIYDVFTLALTNSFLPPILQFINIGHIVNRILAWWHVRPYSKLKSQQESLNKDVQYKEFQLGYAYIYYMNMFYFTCFYVTMQPYVVGPALLGFFLMFWANKYTLLYNSTRPIPSSELLADAMGQLIFLSPFVLAIGNLTWYHFVIEQSIDFSNMIYISRIAALGASLIFFLLPVDSIVGAVCEVPDDEVLVYDNVRKKLSSEYDRLNPATKEDALKQFLNDLSGEERFNVLDMFKFPQQIDSMIANPPQEAKELNIFQKNVSEMSMEELTPQYPHWKKKQPESMGHESLQFQELKEEDSYEHLSHEKIILGVGSPNKKRSRHTRKRVMAQQERKQESMRGEHEFKAFQSDMKGYNSTSLKQKKQKEGGSNPYYSLKF